MQAFEQLREALSEAKSLVEAMNAADLRQRSLRLEELRAVIPQLAAKAAIELGCQAREFEAQATQEPRR